MRPPLRVLFLTPHPREGASSRYRVLQYVPLLEQRGIRCTVSPFLSSQFYHIAYAPGHWAKKAAYFTASSLRRLRDVARSGRYDVVFVHLGAFPLGPPWVEWCLSLRGLPFIFDMDDAIFLPHNHRENAILEWLRMPHKLPAILRRSQCVVTGNNFLRGYALQFNARVQVIPTCVDTRQFAPRARPPLQRPLIGWIGSHTTARYLEALRPVLERLARHHDFTFKIVGSSRPFRANGVEIVQEPWELARDVSYFQELDIGVYPLEDEPWALGKAGFKAVQYMAVGVPCVASAIGRNCEIVQDGVNGFLVKSVEEWYNRLGQLLVDEALRTRLGAAGRRTVEEHFSASRHVETYVALLHSVAGRRAAISPGASTPETVVEKSEPNTCLR